MMSSRNAGVVGIVIEARRHVVGQKNVVDDNIPDNILAFIFGRDDISDDMSSTTTFPTTFFEKCRPKMAKNAETTSRNRPFLPQNVVKNVVILSSDNVLSENSARRHFPTTDRPWGRAEPGQQRYKRKTVTIEPRRLRDDKAKNYDISSPRLERREKSSMSVSHLLY